MFRCKNSVSPFDKRPFKTYVKIFMSFLVVLTNVCLKNFGKYLEFRQKIMFGQDFDTLTFFNVTRLEQTGQNLTQPKSPG
ncbi:hypothetical protein BpHYR1_027935 [Brachionus plicatilis]|uniref:Uncharacterized protein n=1 Tax=Brachionus plicatilis TaxID=10195 RepID=A0A3M7PJZ7_BRAPC|nr:hypothetical protein BpHYR1_027935 [Brachionus plicatilis]